MFVAGVDPGSSSATGFCVLEVPLIGAPILHHASDLCGDDAFGFSGLDSSHLDSFSRMVGMGNYLRDILCTYDPDFVFCESPYFNRIPLPYGRLMQLGFLLRKATADFLLRLCLTQSRHRKQKPTWVSRERLVKRAA